MTRGSEECRLRPKVMEVLVLLANHPNRVLTKEEILDQVWHSRFVAESALTRTVAELRRALGDDAGTPRYVETIPKRGYRLIAPVEQPVANAAPIRIAVLPFDNLSHDPEEEYFADGVADAVITELGRIASLRVISRQSTLRYRSSAKSISEIADELNVDTIIEGSAFREGDQIRITAQLINAQSEEHVWAESYESHLKHILEVQRRLARSIAESVRAALSPHDVERLACAPPIDSAAHLAYLKARYHWGKFTGAGLQLGMQYVREAVEHDPTYAPAWEMIASCLALLGFWGHLPAPGAYAQARQAGKMALQLDDTLAEAHAIMGLIRCAQDWDIAGGYAEVRRAIELNRNSELAWMTSAILHSIVRRDPELSLAHGQRALELDPLSLNTNFSLGWVYVFNGEYELALERAAKTLELYPDALHALYVWGWACLGLGRTKESVASFEQAAQISREVSSLSFLGHAYGRAGGEEQARALYEELLDRSTREHVSAADLLLIASSFRDLGEAMGHLERCWEDRDAHLLWLPAMPVSESFRGDPRFEALARRIMEHVTADSGQAESLSHSPSH